MEIPDDQDGPAAAENYQKEIEMEDMTVKKLVDQ